jgi:choline dehydrogenase-like flavoprotein
MNQENYDVVIVGGGIAGGIVARTLVEAGARVLMLEAGLDAGMDFNPAAAKANYESYLDRFYRASAKVPNAPYPNLNNAPSPNVLDLTPIPPGGAITNGYFVQNGKLPFASDYARTPGGTTLHWLGTCLRMLPNDFKLQSTYGRGVDWPIRYEDLKPYYEMAEREIGVSGDVEDQRYPGIDASFFGPDYRFPMRAIPTSYLDHKFTERVGGSTVEVGGRSYPIYLVSTPQGRNSIPTAGYGRTQVAWSKEKQKLELGRDERADYNPVGAIWDPYIGQRCEGNASCVPICPVQAKYNAMKTIRIAKAKGLEIRTQSVASKVEFDSDTGRATAVVYKRYETDASAAYVERRASGTLIVLAAHAVENAKLLLASNMRDTSGQLGRNLMDHAVFFAWGLMPEKVYSFRGPGSTSNIPTFRDGPFRKDFSAFILPIDNWGWGWPTNAPGSDVADAVTQKNLFGPALREHLGETVTRQMFMHYECEQLPLSTNRVTIDEAWKDALGNYRPIITYDVDDYTRRAFEVATGFTAQMFAHGGIENFTEYGPTDPDYLQYRGVGYSFGGAGHLVGTHRMGTHSDNSVVDQHQRAWHHPNLYVVGCGSMPTIGTSNPTLTMSAMAFMAAESMLRDLGPLDDRS